MMADGLTATILPFRSMSELLNSPNGALPNRIREHRKSRKWTLEHLAGLAGCSAAQLSDLERGERGLSLHWMKRMAAALGVEPADLLLEQDNALGLSIDERDLVLRYRSAEDGQRHQIKAMLDVIIPRNEASAAA